MLCNMKKIIIPILLGLALAFTSCEKLLDIPQKGVISYSGFFESDEDAMAARSNMYAKFADNVAGATGYIYNPQLMILNYSADDVLAAGGDATDHGDFRVFDEFRYDSLNPALRACTTTTLRPSTPVTSSSPTSRPRTVTATPRSSRAPSRSSASRKPASCAHGFI